MAEYCYRCFVKILEGDVKEKDVIISKEFDLCEGCAEFKPVVVRWKKIFLFKETIKRFWKCQFNARK